MPTELLEPARWGRNKLFGGPDRFSGVAESTAFQSKERWMGSKEPV